MVDVLCCLNFEAGEVLGILILAKFENYIFAKTFSVKIHVVNYIPNSFKSQPEDGVK